MCRSELEGEGIIGFGIDSNKVSVQVHFQPSVKYPLLVMLYPVQTGARWCICDVGMEPQRGQWTSHQTLLPEQKALVVSWHVNHFLQEQATPLCHRPEQGDVP